MVQAEAVAQVETEEFTRVLQRFLGVKSARYPGQQKRQDKSAKSADK